MPRELERDAQALRDLGYNIELALEGQRVYVIFRDFSLGEKFQPQRTDLMVFTTILYPNAGFDMFWVDEKVRLADGRIPQAADAIEHYMGRPWRRFSWHLNRAWSPIRDSLPSWISYVEERIAKGV